MNCFRCGRETEEEQAFCLDCQKETAKYPIDANAVVQLPVRKQAVQKKPLKRRVPLEEQVRLLTRRVHLLTCLLIAALLAAICLSISVVQVMGNQHFQIGQNYTTVKPTTVPTEVVTLPE